MNITELKELAEDLQINNEYCPKEVIQKASAAILELIAKLEDAKAQMERQKDEWLSWEAKRRDLEKAAAQLEDAQGEIRALRATEDGLRERVKELEALLERAPVFFSHHDFDGEKLEFLQACSALLEKKE